MNNNNELLQHKKSDTVKWILTLIAFILVGVMLIGIILGWFEKKEVQGEREEASAISAQSMGSEIELTSGKSARSLISTYAATDTVTPPCQHLTETVYNTLIDTGRGDLYLRLNTIGQPATLNIKDRDTGSSFSDSVFFAEYTGSSINCYFTTAIWCFHGIKSYFCDRYGYFYSDFEIDWDYYAFSSDWDKISSKPVMQENYDPATDTLQLKIECIFYYATNTPQPHCHFPSTSIAFTAVKGDYVPHGAGLCDHVEHGDYNESTGPHASISFEKKSEGGNFNACFFNRATGRQLFTLDKNAIAQYAASYMSYGRQHWYTDAYICIHDVINRAIDKGVRISNITFAYPDAEEITCGNPEAEDGRLSVKVRLSGSEHYPLMYLGGDSSYKFYVDAEALDGWQLLPPDPAKTGYTFSGWYEDEERTELFEGGMVSDDMTLYAGWTINVYTLTLDTNGGLLDYGKETVKGDYNTVPEIPVPDYYGYTFLGWQTSDGQVYDVETPLTQDLTLVAQWQINIYTLMFDANGGEVSPTSMSGEYYSLAEVPTPTRTGYTFVSWKTSDNKSFSGRFERDLTLVAQWEINTYTITFNANGGEVSTISDSGVYNTMPTIPTPTRKGHTFQGWKTADGKVYDEESPFTQDLTLVAQWEINTYTVTFIVDGVLYDTMSFEYGTKLANIAQTVEPTLFMMRSYDGAGISLASDYALEGDITVHAEKGTTAQQVQGNWKKIVIGGALGAALIAFLCCIPSMIKHRKSRA